MRPLSRAIWRESSHLPASIWACGFALLASTVAAAGAQLTRVSSAPGTAAAEQTGDDAAVGDSAAARARWREELFAALARRRADLGLAALVREERLDRAAQAHADEMAAQGWFGFSSPAGTSVERRVEDSGYAAKVVAAKVYRVPLAAEPAALVESWWTDAGGSRQSVFHSAVEAVGIGTAASGGERFFAFVLASGAAALPRSLGLDTGERRAAFLAAANGARAARHLPALIADARLDRAAQQHAEALLAALRAGKSPDSVPTLADRLNTGAVANPALMAVDKPNAGGTADYHDKTPGREGDKLGGRAIGNTILVDALSAPAAVDAAAELANADVLAAGYRRLGVGVAVDMSGAAPHVVWVACLTRR
jgi:uncharacterized protein YkwD